MFVAKSWTGETTSFDSFLQAQKWAREHLSHWQERENGDYINEYRAGNMYILNVAVEGEPTDSLVVVKLASSHLTLSREKMDALYESYLRGTGGVIVNIEHPEWGRHQVVNRTTHDGCTWWDIRSASGTTVLHMNELGFWRAG